MNDLETRAAALAKDPAVQRLYDLVRYARGYLFDNELITQTEYDALVATGSDSARRLERYDEIRLALEKSIELQSHYAKLLNQFDGGERLLFVNADAWLKRLPTVKAFVQLGLLRERGMEEQQNNMPECYALGDRGKAYVDALQRVPLPKQVWWQPPSDGAVLPHIESARKPSRMEDGTP